MGFGTRNVDLAPILSRYSIVFSLILVNCCYFIQYWPEGCDRQTLIVVAKCGASTGQQHASELLGAGGGGRGAPSGGRDG